MTTSTSAIAQPNIDCASETRAAETQLACTQVHTLLIENAILGRAMARQQERHSQYVQETKQMMELMLARQNQLEQQVRELLLENRQDHEFVTHASHRSS